MKVRKKEIQELVEEIFSLYEQFGSADYIGEPVSQIEHMSQAAGLALKEGHEEEVVLAAFFHDIGHICTLRAIDKDMAGFGKLDHEKAGAEFLTNCGFYKKITTLIENHIPAKRYLTFKYPEYYTSLSEASKKTLEFQGGIMDQDEAQQFEDSPYFQESIRLRKWDEQAKEENVSLIDLELLKEMARKHLENKSTRSL